LATVDKKVAIPFLNKLGYSRSTARPVWYGPLKYGGLNLHPLKDIQGSGQILQCLKHLQTPLVVQRLWLIALHWARLQSGFHKPILEDPNTPIPHLESQYIHSIRQFLQSINGSIRTEIPYTVPLQWAQDQSIMEIVVQSTLFLAPPSPHPLWPCFSRRDQNWSNLREEAETAPIIASDRSVWQNIHRGTFAWVLAAADRTPWLKCKGPMGGLHVDSVRAEG
jgi:hypothetical protein